LRASCFSRRVWVRCPLESRFIFFFGLIGLLVIGVILNRMFSFVLVIDHRFKRPRNHLVNLAPVVFCCLSWAVMDQNVILSPQSQVMEVDPRFSPFAADSMTGSFDIVFLQFGHVIEFSIVSS
jgi:hypothetical protein